jgi:hypothetical protein
VQSTRAMAASRYAEGKKPRAITERDIPIGIVGGHARLHAADRVGARLLR